MKKLITSIAVTSLAACLSVAASAATVNPSQACAKTVDPAPCASISNCKPDTGKTLSIEVGKTYTYKVTSVNGEKPVLHISEDSFKVTADYSVGNDFFFTIKAVGDVGDTAEIYINDETTPRTVVTIVAAKPQPKEVCKPASKDTHKENAKAEVKAAPKATQKAEPKANSNTKSATPSSNSNSCAKSAAK